MPGQPHARIAKGTKNAKKKSPALTWRSLRCSREAVYLPNPPDQRIIPRMTKSDRTTHPPGALREVVLLFLRLGVTAFGGPAAGPLESSYV